VQEVLGHYTGTVAGGVTGEAHWPLIPAPGSAGLLPTGRKYLVGARPTVATRMLAPAQVPA
jgi:hypothetical protein